RVCCHAAAPGGGRAADGGASGRRRTGRKEKPHQDNGKKPKSAKFHRNHSCRCEKKAIKGCTARIVPDHSGFRKRKSNRHRDELHDRSSQSLRPVICGRRLPGQICLISAEESWLRRFSGPHLTKTQGLQRRCLSRRPYQIVFHDATVRTPGLDAADEQVRPFSRAGGGNARTGSPFEGFE